MSTNESNKTNPSLLLQDMKSRFSYAENWRAQWDTIATEDYNLYIGYRAPLSEENVGRSNLHIPRTAENVDTLRARMMEAFFGTSRPYIDFLPMPGRGATPKIMQGLELKAMMGSLEAHLIDAEAAQAVAAMDGSRLLLLPHIRSRVKVVNDVGKYAVRVVDSEGDPRGNGSGGFMTIKDFVAELKSKSDFAGAFKPSGNTGSGM